MAIYVPDVPQGTQQINQTNNPIQQNFDYIYNLMAVNHIPFNTMDTFGNHNIVNFISQSNDPSTGSSEIALYSKSINNDPKNLQLFYRYPNNGVINQLTGNTQNSGSSGSGGGSFNINTGSITSSLPNSGGGYLLSGYWQYLSNGILIITGVVSNYITQPPTFANPFNITIPSGLTDINGVIIPSYTQTPFNVQLAALTPQYGSNVNYAATATSRTTATCYYSGTISSSSSTTFCQTTLATFIGV